MDGRMDGRTDGRTDVVRCRGVEPSASTRHDTAKHSSPRGVGEQSSILDKQTASIVLVSLQLTVVPSVVPSVLRSFIRSFGHCRYSGVEWSGMEWNSVRGAVVLVLQQQCLVSRRVLRACRARCPFRAARARAATSARVCLLLDSVV